MKIWKSKFPIAYAHLSHAKAKLSDIAINLNIPLENLIGPELVRKICFDQANEQLQKMSPALLSRVETQLRVNGAREWQIEKCSHALAESLGQAQPLPPSAPIQDETEAQE